MIGVDTATFHYPMYSFLGEQLRGGHVPGWNPAQFAGAPFAGDPESGWMYLPAMLLFTILPLAAAAKTLAVFHLALAGLTTYAFARVLRLSVVGALVAAVAYEFSGYFLAFSVSIPTYVEVAAWLPLALLGLELALGSGDWRTRGACWGLSGLALSQIVGAWLGQGAYYALLAFGSYAAYRALLVLPPPVPRWRHRIQSLVLNVAAVLLIGVALAAAGILPRLEFHAVSNLAHGYEGSAADLGGWRLSTLPLPLLARANNAYYVGVVTLALAVLALRHVRGRPITGYFVLLSLGVLAFASVNTMPLPLSALYHLMPAQIADFHQHVPERIMVIFYLGPAVLAGSTVSALRRWPLANAVLLVVLVGDLLCVGRFAMASQGIRVNPGAYYDPSGAAAFLRAQAGGQPFRYLGYDPGLTATAAGSGEQLLYRDYWSDPRAAALLVNSRATLFGLQDVQGYNPIQLQRYVAYIAVLNGHAQEYHGSYVYADGLASPLLDLLNARYIIVPAQAPADRPDLLRLTHSLPTVYRDARERVLENRAALPRSWLVHAARQVAPGETLQLLGSGVVNPRQTALLEARSPMLAQPADPATDQAVIASYAPDRVRVRTHSTAAALLMLSDTYYPAWHAYVDGKRAELYAADGALRGIPVPAGTHTVELRYEDAPLRVGLAVSLAAYLALCVLLAAAGWRHGRTHLGRFT